MIANVIYNKGLSLSEHELCKEGQEIIKRAAELGDPDAHDYLVRKKELENLFRNVDSNTH